MSLTYEEVSEILRLVDASDLHELVLEMGDLKLVLRRHGSAVPEPSPTQVDVAEKPVDGAKIVASAFAETADPPEPGAVAVDSPMVGRVYFKPSPDEPAFAEVGGRIAAGDTLCLIEVMKLFTQVEAPISGTIISRAVEDGDAVQYDQPLFWIRPE